MWSFGCPWPIPRNIVNAWCHCTVITVNSLTGIKSQMTFMTHSYCVLTTILADVHSLQRKFTTAKVPTHKTFLWTNFCSRESFRERQCNGVKVPRTYWNFYSPVQRIKYFVTIALYKFTFTIIIYHYQTYPGRGAACKRGQVPCGAKTIDKSILRVHLSGVHSDQHHNGRRTFPFWCDSWFGPDWIFRSS